MVIKTRSFKWAGHALHMEEMGKCIQNFSRKYCSWRRRYRLEDNIKVELEDRM